MTDEKSVAEIVSRETFEKFKIFAALLKKWNPKINLVAKSTIDVLWERHFLDSIQFFDLIEKTGGKWVDLGSGGGFPGAVLAIMGSEIHEQPEIILIESDQRKAVFLRTVFRETGVSAKVLTTRIEKTPALNADLMTARALADLKTLLGFTKTHLSPAGTALFAKGENWKKELAEAREIWQFDSEVVKSRTDSNAVILKIQGLSHV